MFIDFVITVCDRILRPNFFRVCSGVTGTWGLERMGCRSSGSEKRARGALLESSEFCPIRVFEFKMPLLKPNPTKEAGYQPYPALCGGSKQITIPAGLLSSINLH